jgi:hypothetical protein
MSDHRSRRRDRDERAQSDAFRYIASWRDTWDEEEFFRSGAKDYRSLVQPVLARYQFDPAGTNWRGAVFSVEAARVVLRESGASLIETRDEGSPATWCTGKR